MMLLVLPAALGSDGPPSAKRRQPALGRRALWVIIIC
jgi:hypothetical protein